MTHVTKAEVALFMAQVHLANAVLDGHSEAGTIGEAMGCVREAIAVLEQISQPGTSPQQTGDGANLSPAGDQE